MIHVCISGSLVDTGARTEAEEEERKRGIGERKRWCWFLGLGPSRVVVTDGWLVGRRIAHPSG